MRYNSTIISQEYYQGDSVLFKIKNTISNRTVFYFMSSEGISTHHSLSNLEKCITGELSFNAISIGVQAEFEVQHLLNSEGLDDEFRKLIESKLEVWCGITPTKPNVITNKLKSYGDTPNLPYQREHEKLGRNAQCICGSGLKFKYCCIHKGKHYE